MLKDHYGNPLSTTSTAAQDAYIRAVDLFLAAQSGVDAAFREAIAADEGFALAHLGLARNQQVVGEGRAARETLTVARSVAGGITHQEAGQLETLGLLIEGKSSDAYRAARAQLADHPRDAMTAQTCVGVFGLIGFSGLPGREAETLALAEILAPHYGDDWWFLGSLSFAQVEAGQTGPAEASIERSIALKPDNANAAHYRSHLYYEVGETEAGYAYLEDWLRGYDKSALMHCHLSWHIALWALARGDTDTMWQVVDADIDPRSGSGPPINVMADTAAILYRAELAGIDVPPERWQVVSDYAARCFPKPGLAFADVHAALAHAMAGRGEAVAEIVANARGPAADMVTLLAETFDALAGERWQDACSHLTVALSDHARIGGSRAQRDLLEYAMVSALLKLGQSEEAGRLLRMRRPMTDAARAVAGLPAD